MKVFLTGATGFVGANVARELVSNGFQVKALVRPESQRTNIEGLPIEVVEGDLLDQRLLVNALRGCRALFHCAAHYSLWMKDAGLLYQVNVEGTRRILEAAREARIEKAVYTSSVAAIGVPPLGQVGTEETRTTIEDLVSDYKKSKFLAEIEVKRVCATGLPVVIVNPSTPIGPYDAKPTPTGQIVLDFLKGKIPFYVHTGLNLIDVRDVARGHVLALERGRSGERYILGHENVTFKAMLDTLAEITGRPAPRHAIPYFVPFTAALVDEVVLGKFFGKKPAVSLYSVMMSRKPMYYDASKAIRELSLPQSPVRDALQSAVDWFRENRYV